MLREEITRCSGKQQENQSENASARHDQYLDSSYFYKTNKNHASNAVSQCFKCRLPFSAISSCSPLSSIFLTFFPSLMPLSSSSTVNYQNCITPIANMNHHHHYHLPYFLFTKKATVSQIQHYFFMWINASLKPKLLPIFWIWLSQPQRLIIRSRLHKRIHRLKKKPTMNNINYHMRRNHRFHWYGIFPLPPTRRTRSIWKKKKNQQHLLLLPIQKSDYPEAISKPSPATTATTATTASPPPPPPPTQKRKIKKNWMPPINSETVQELSIANIFKSIQLRHDLLFDPQLSFRPNLDGRTGREKCRKSQRYWRRANHAIQSIIISTHQHHHHQQQQQSLDFLRIVLNELQKILISLHSPFESTPASHEPWPWPSHISLDHFYTVFDVEFIIHQIQHGLFGLDSVIRLIMDILTPLCPLAETARLSSLNDALYDRNIGYALRQCFSILEVIKLDCANRILHQYRPYLLGTCSKIEFHCFKRQLDSGQIKLDSTYHWLQHQWKQQQRTQENASFYNVYHRGLIELVAATYQLDDPPLQFPITLQFDERRLTQQLRQEFQSLILISIVLIPYRYIAGPFATTSDMARLKRTCIELCKDGALMGPAGDIFTFFDGDGGHSVLQIGYRLAYKACHHAFQAHYRHHVIENQKACGIGGGGGGNNDDDDDDDNDDDEEEEEGDRKMPLLSMDALGADQLCQVSQFWANWLLGLLKARNSRLYSLIHQRLCDSLCFISQHGTTALAENAPMMTTMDLMMGIQDTIVMLGEKLKILADLNLETFGSIYKVIALDILQQKLD